MKKVFITWIMLLVVGLFVTGCGSSPETTEKTAAPEAQTNKYGGTLRISVQEPSVLGYPATMTGQTDGQSSSVALETLFRFDEKLNLVPLLATDWKADPAAKTLTISLRKGVKFHDGTDFNAQAVKWNLDQFRAGKRAELKLVASIDVVDDYTVKLNLSKFDNTIITNLANVSDAGRMISPAAFAKNGEAWCEQNPVGTGPFQFVSRQKDVGINWKRFDGYWGGKPYLDAIEMVRYADTNVALLDFKSGNLDITGVSIDPRTAKALEAEGEYSMVVPPEGQVPALAGYAKDPNSPFAKLEVRQALAYAVDSKTLAETFGLGFYQVQNQWAVPGSWGYSTKVAGYPYNPQKAKELLAAAGYPNGFNTTLSFYNLSPQYIDEATAIQRMLKEVGITVTLNPLLRPAFAEAASLGKGWDGILRIQGFSSPDPLIKYAGVAVGQEFAGMYLPDEFKGVYDQAIKAGDFETKQKLVHQLMEVSTDKYAMAAHLYVATNPIFKSKRVHDDLYGEVPYRYLSPMTWIGE